MADENKKKIDLSIPSNAPLVDPKTGRASPSWQVWFNNLYKRVGGSTALDNNQLEEGNSNNEINITELEGKITENTDNIKANKDSIDYLKEKQAEDRTDIAINQGLIRKNEVDIFSLQNSVNYLNMNSLFTITSVGSGISIYKDKTVTNANLKSLKAGTNITLDNTTDVNTITISAVSYTLPVATDTILGGVKVGSGLSITSDGILSNSYSYNLPIASTTVLGGVKIGSGISITSDGTISSSSSYTLPVATDTILGGVKVGSGLSITSDGILSASGGGGGVNEGAGSGGVDSSTVYGKHSLEVNTTGSKNTLIGNSNLKVNTTGSRNVISGYGNLIKGVNSNDNNIHGNDNFPQLVGDLGNNLVFGSNNFKNSQYSGGISNAGNIIFGNDNFSDTKTDVPRAIISIGHGNFKNLNAAGSSNTAIGSYIFTSLTNGQNNIGIGQTGTLTQLTTGSSNTGIGNAAGTWITTGSYNYCIGLAAMQGSSSSPITGSFNVGVGFGALRNARTNSYSVGIGYQAGNYAIYDNTTSLGANSDVTGANQVQLGDSATTTYVYGTVQNRSDERDKADIIDTRLGLDFILKLRPIDFKWDMREDYVERVMGLVEKERIIYDADGNETIEKYKEHDYIKTIRHTKDGSKKRNRYHSGLSAQQLKQVCDELGIDFGGFQDHSIDGGRDVLSIGYDEFIAPLIKSIQQQQEIILNLTKRIETLENLK